jgi:hypothetical protein
LSYSFASQGSRLVATQRRLTVPRPKLERLASIAWLAVTGGLLATFAAVSALAIESAGHLGMDYGFYRDVGARWLADGSYYLPHQLAGPYDLELMRDVLYPPTGLLLFVPAALLPAVLWWAVPIGVAIYVAREWNPQRWAIGTALLLLAWPRAHAAFMFGNTDMWAMAAVAAGLRWGWPAILVALKPTLALVALIGIRRESWWIAAFALGLLAAATMSLWLDYFIVLGNTRNMGLDYSLGAIPLLGVPIVLWVGRSRDVRDRSESERPNHAMTGISSSGTSLIE